MYEVTCPNNCKMTVCGIEMKSCACISDNEDEIIRCTVCGAIMYSPLQFKK